MKQKKATMKSEDSNYDREFRKCLQELLSNYLDSDDDDGFDDDIDIFWGLAFDESIIENIKVILITSSK